MLGKLFKPRWQHRNPAIRAQATASLDPVDDAETLLALARDDQTAAVRIAACRRLRAPDALRHRIRDDSDAEVRDVALNRLQALTAGSAPDAPPDPLRMSWIRDTDSLPVLLHVVRHAEDAESRELALAQIRDAETLLELALSGHDEAQRLRAAQRLNDADRLRQLSRQGRDKRVVQHARKWLKLHQQEEAEARRHRERVAATVDSLEHLATAASDPLFEARLQMQHQQWLELAEQADDSHRDRAERALNRCQAYLREKVEAQEQEQARQQHEQEREAVLSALESLLGDGQPDWDEPLDDWRAAIHTEEQRWQAAVADDPPADPGHPQRFRKLVERAYWLADLADAAREADPEQLRELARQWPQALTAPTALRDSRQATTADHGLEAHADEAHGKRQTRSPSSRHRGLVAALRRELQQGNLKHANRLWHRAEVLVTKEEDRWLAGQLVKLHSRRDELRDWHAFAAEPKKTALCEDMEALADTETELDAPERASAIQALHDQWRALMSSDQDQDQALWDRFKAASDRAYLPCRAYFAELDAQRADNLERRRQLCDQLDDFIRQENWAKADWHAVWEIRRAAPGEWRQLSPVRFTDVRDLKKRFSALLADLDRRLDEAWQKAEARRQELIETAAELGQRDDLHEAIRQARDLQKQWREAPWLPPARHRALNKRFRRQMDALFAARDNDKEQRRRDQHNQRSQAEMRLPEIARQLDLPLAEQDPAVLARLDDELDRLRPALDRNGRRQAEKTGQLLLQLRRLLPFWHQWSDGLAHLASQPDGQANDPDRTLAVALEVLADRPSPEEAHAVRLAWQLEQLPRLMKTANFRPIDEALTLLRERVEGPLDPDLRSRMEAALMALEPRMEPGHAKKP